MNRIVKWSLIFCSIFSLEKMTAQELSTLFKTNPLKINGGITASTLVNHSTSKQGSRDPFIYNLGGNVNLTFVEWSMPFQFMYSNAGASSGSQVPSIYAIRPSYKWIKLHAGLGLSMSFSPYTMAGQMFDGAGIELSPKGKFKFQALYGRFLKPIFFDSVRNNRPMYNRMGAAAKVDYKHEKFSLAYNFLFAEDQARSLPQVYEKLDVLPQKNLAMGLQFQSQLTSAISVDGEIGGSLLTRDKRAPEDGKLGFIGNWINHNSTTQLYKAIKLNSTLNAKIFTLGAGFERIDPNYMAMGALNYNNDIQSISGNFAIPLFQNKVNLAASMGYQTDNLNDQKANETGRLVQSVQLKVTPSEKLNFNSSYSNFSSVTAMRPYQEVVSGVRPLDADSLRFQVVNNALNLGVNYVLAASEKSVHNLSNQFAFTQNTSQRGDNSMPATTNLNFNSSYSISFPKSKLNLNAGVNVNTMKMDTNSNLNLAPMFSASMPIKIKEKEEIKTNASLMYNTSYTNGNAGVGTFSMRASASYTLAKKHNLSYMLGTTYNTALGNAPAVFMLNTGLNYSYSFSLLEPKSKK